MKIHARSFALRFVLFCALISSFPFASLAEEEKSSPAAPTGSPLVESRTATELPEKRKIPTSREIGVRPEESDRQIRNRLTRIAASQPVFQRIQVAVKEGIVDLTGKVEEASVAKSFSALSERMEGVIGVVDQIEVLDPKKSGLRVAQSEATALVQKFFRAIPYLLSALAIFMITLLIAFGVLRFWRMVVRKRMSDSPMLAETTARALTAPIYLLGFYLILQVGGLSGLATTVLGGTGMLGIILGLAGKNILENYLAGFMLTLRNPFKVGDQVTIGQDKGSVYSVNSRCTMLLDGDGILVQIPNSVVLASIIRNRTAHSMNQITLRIPLEPCSDIGDFREAFAEAIAKSPNAVAADPKAQAFISTVVDGVVLMECQFWVDTIAHSTDKVRSNVLEALLLGLEERDVEIARSGKFPQFNVSAPDPTPAPQKETAVKTDKKRRGLEESVTAESDVPSESKVFESRVGEVKNPEAPGLRKDLNPKTDKLAGTSPNS